VKQESLQTKPTNPKPIKLSIQNLSNKNGMGNISVGLYDRVGEIEKIVSLTK